MFPLKLMFSALLYRNLVCKGNNCRSKQNPSIKIEDSYKGDGEGEVYRAS